MSHGKETPRQKMIGMMYLVLTALLALNVQKEVLNAFANVDHGINKIMHNFVEKNDNLYADFAEKATVNPQKVGPFYKKAQEVQEKANKLYEEIQEYKEKIVVTAEGDEEAIDHGHIDLNKVEGKDNMDIPAQIMVTEGRAKELKANIESFREYLKELAEDHPNLIESIETNLNTAPHELPDGTKHAWESANFEHLPLAGVIALMSGLQTDIRNAESDMLKHLYDQIDAGSIPFNKLEAVVIPNSSYIIKGNQYRAEVFLAAFDTTQDPKVLIGDYEKYVEDGIEKYRMVGRYDSLNVELGTGRGLYEQPGNRIGDFSWGGLIQLQRPDGSYIEKPFKVSYQVAESNAVVSPTKMNVFYMGVDNPVEISVAGIPSDKIFPEISNGSIRKVRGAQFTVSPKRPGESMLTVYAEIDGQRKNMGTKNFRIKRLPNPVAMVGNRPGGAIEKSRLVVQTGVQAVLEDFVFDLEFKVTEFTVSATVKQFVKSVPTKGNQFTQDQIDIMNSVNRGGKLYIEDIKAVGPDGAVRELQTISFLIQ